MKKTIKSFAIVLLFAAFIFSLAGCEKDNAPTNEEKKAPSLVGTWELKDPDYTSIYVFNEDGKGTYTLTAGDESDTSAFTYKVEETKLLVTYEGDEEATDLKYTLNGNTLVIRDSFDEEMTFTKK